MVNWWVTLWRNNLQQLKETRETNVYWTLSDRYNRWTNKKTRKYISSTPIISLSRTVILCQTWNWYDYAKMNIIRSFVFLCLLAALLLSVVLARLFCSLCPHVANFLCVSNLQPQQTQVFISETRLCFITGRFYELLLPLHRYYYSKHSSFTRL